MTRPSLLRWTPTAVRGARNGTRPPAARPVARSSPPTAIRRRLASSTAPGSSPFPVFRDVPPLRELRNQLFREGRQVGFVPTMGALHDGHLSLVREALKENTDVFVSIFVNPTQFAVHEDLDSYPKTWEEDMRKLQQVQDEHAAAPGDNRDAKIRGIFAPTTKVMYPTLPPTSDIAGNGSFVTITPLGRQLEGSSRPIFFRGVATVCMKLFNIVQATRVYFGQKDVQQSVLIKRMVKDFHINTEVRVIPTSREPDGLAMSSRNVYLGERRRKDAVVLSRALFAARDLYRSGQLNAGRLKKAAHQVFEAAQAVTEGDGAQSCTIEIDYIALTRPDMGTINASESIDVREGAILSAAVYVSPVNSPGTEEELKQRTVRLIDNVILEATAA